MSVLSFISNMFCWNKNHIPQKTTITSTEECDWGNFWESYYFPYTRKRKYKGFHWRRPI